MYIYFFIQHYIFLDEPDAPGKPAITDWDKDHVDLEWTPPKNDGGSPITGYIIQKKEKGSPYWINAVNVPARKNAATVPDLIEGQEYEFRVIATNNAGQSEPSERSDMVMAKARFCEYCKCEYISIFTKLLFLQWLLKSKHRSMIYALKQDLFYM